ncbi:MAG TPA: hypothetical protein PK719_04625 [Bacteroidales bacterium]|jgi:hypothetical protein|nr:hypothetical protein [Bacteroidales bacterium]OQB60191.1 MAG: hypothetical protein BWX96_02328 [Bacteroidetes bacterium ADurb.Bin145]NMD02528.1 hypothetical protein [Bacteroidales bacterium]HOU03100.1 hypothetical protein [Bacteroidales bacterium]HQG62918.1 hypothetical protein [Bacteroidales bacterium]
MKKLLLPLVLTVFSIPMFSQLPDSQSDTLRVNALNVFMTASDYIKKEIPYINYVRDRQDADVYIISTQESTGSGGYVSTFFIVGQGKYNGMADTVKCNINPDETSDTRRAKEVKTLKMGLMRYIQKTPLSEYININFNKPLTETVSSDKWNSWVFRTSLSGYLNGQSSRKVNYLSTSFSANRITEKSKFESNFSLYNEKDKISYKFGDTDTTYISTYEQKYAYLSYVKSINNHWSGGASVTVQSYPYNNYDLSIKFAPGIEYDIFPYAESTRRILTFLYRAGVEINNYTEETSRFKQKETVAFHSLSAYMSYIQKWGSISSTLSWSNYFFDWSYNKLRLYTYASVRIFKGISFNIQGQVSMVHDQIFLPRGDMALEDVLLQRKAQKTTYTYYTSIGFSYTFGSIYNNVVNPRFND